MRLYRPNRHESCANGNEDECGPHPPAMTGGEGGTPPPKGRPGHERQDGGTLDAAQPQQHQQRSDAAGRMRGPLKPRSVRIMDKHRNRQAQQESQPDMADEHGDGPVVVRSCPAERHADKSRCDGAPGTEQEDGPQLLRLQPFRTRQNDPEHEHGQQDPAKVDSPAEVLCPEQAEDMQAQVGDEHRCRGGKRRAPSRARLAQQQPCCDPVGRQDHLRDA